MEPSSDGRERRYVLRVPELRMAGESSNTLVGHAAVFGEWADIMGLFREQIARGAFARALAERQDVVARWEHRYDTILGRTSSGTLRLSEDDIGLVAEIDIPDTTLGADLRALVKRGDVRGMSFEFGLARDGRGERWAGDDRTIVEVERLYDVSAVINPAYEGTDVALRSRTASADAERRARAARLLSRVRLYIARTKGV
jgi:HK97 family phage prohead protease